MRGGEVAISAFLTRLPDPGHAVSLQDCKISTFGRALHRLDQVQAAWRAAARHWWQFAKVTKSRGFTSLDRDTRGMVNLRYRNAILAC